MNFIEDMDKLIYEIKQDVKTVEKYIEQLENDNVYWDTLTVESIIEELEDKIRSLYVLIN